MATLEELDAQIAELEGQIATSMQEGGGSPDYSAFYQSPGYEFRFDEGQRAIERSAAARGGLMSGGMGRELVRYGQGVATSEFGNYANRLASLAGIGQTANQQGIYAGANAGSQVGTTSGQLGQTIMSSGTAQAFGIAGAGNALASGIQGAAGAFGAGIQQYGAGQGWWGGLDPSTGINWTSGRF